MPDLQFSVISTSAAEAEPSSLRFQLQIENLHGQETIQSISLNVQLHIQPSLRHYTREEQLALQDLFGTPERWSDTMRPLFWTRASVTVPGFQGATMLDLIVPCSFESNFSAAKYFLALEEGDAFVELLFNGIVFYEQDEFVQVAFIPWSKEAACRIPVSLLALLAWTNRLNQQDSQIPPVEPWRQIVEQAIASASTPPNASVVDPGRKKA